MIDHNTTNVEEYPEIEHHALILGSGPEVTPRRQPDLEQFSSIEIGEMAEQFAVMESHRVDFGVSQEGHGLLTVGYPVDANIAQHDTHLNLQQEYEMVMSGSEVFENPEGYHDYHVVRYMHRDDYDDAVLNGQVEYYR